MSVEKRHISLAVIGPVESGKSSLVGFLYYKCRNDHICFSYCKWEELTNEQ